MSANRKEMVDTLAAGIGVSGGWAAQRLSEAGLKVAIVGAGRQPSAKNFTEHEPKIKLKYRDMAPEMVRRTRPVQKDCYACMEYHHDPLVPALSKSMQSSEMNHE